MMTSSSTPSSVARREAASASRESAVRTTADVGSVLTGANTGGIAAKIALGRAAYRLIRRYPVAALVVGGIGVVYLMASHHADSHTIRN